MTETWLQSYARQLVLKALSQIQHGQLTILSKYPGAATPAVIFGQQLTKGKDKEDKITAVVFKDPNAWTRICRAFDLVRYLKPLIELAMRINPKFLGICRSLHAAGG